MPCLPNEPGCANGSVVVRSPDGTHFCPVRETDQIAPVCPVWSGGAFRFGAALAEAVRQT
jgi:hypothetical protein